MPELSRRVQTFTDSVIRRMTRINNMTPGSINLSQGFPDFDPPQEILDALKEAAEHGPHQYSITFGAKNFRDALAEMYTKKFAREIDPEKEIVVTCGGTEAMMAAMMTVCNPGDKVAVFSPFYENYGADAILSGADPVYVPLVPPDFHYDSEALERAFEAGVKALILCNPSNPCGKVFTMEEMEEIAELAKKYDTVGTERTFSTYDNQEITVSGGNYGWVIDQEKETDALYQDIMDKKTEVREPVYEQEAQSRNTNDIGYSYIEIDLTRQRMVLYQNGSPIVDTGFAASSSTPTGVYRLGDKQEAASVDFWMPFTDKLGIYGDSGLVITGTDLSDETGDSGDFGSSEESVDFGSSDSWMSTEGCIVLPEEQAQTIYQNVDSGLPVVIY